MHKTTFIFGSAVVASVVVSFLIFTLLGSSQKATKTTDTKRTVHLLVPLNDKSLSSAFATYNITATIKKVELTGKGTKLTLDNKHVPTAIVTINTNIASATPVKGISVLLPKNLAAGQDIKLSLRQNLNDLKEQTVTQVIILSPLSIPTPTARASSAKPLPTKTP